MIKAVLKTIIPARIRLTLRQYIDNFMYFNVNFAGKPKMYNIKFKNKNLNVSNMIDITHWSKVEFGDNVFIWHFTILDSYNGIKIGNDCQIGTRVTILTHSSHNSIRYYNKDYGKISFTEHKGRVKGSVEIGNCSFIGANSIIMPNTKIGKGCVVSAYSYVNGNFDDFSLISGNPAKKIGDVRAFDYMFLRDNPDLLESYIQYFNLKKTTK